jgi:hypothetical protein
MLSGLKFSEAGTYILDQTWMCLELPPYLVPRSQARIHPGRVHLPRDQFPIAQVPQALAAVAC